MHLAAPEDAPAWTNRGLAFVGLRFHAHALKDFDRAIELQPTQTEALIHRAGVRLAEADLAGAERGLHPGD